MSLESEIQRRIEAEVGAEPDFLILKNSCGVATHYSAEGGAWKVPYGLGSGSPDLVGMHRVGAVLAAWVALEVKRPGEKPDPHQLKCHDVWRRFGALVYVVTSPEEARAALVDARWQVSAWLNDEAARRAAGEVRT